MLPAKNVGQGPMGQAPGWQPLEWRQRPWSQKMGRRLFHMAVGSLFPVLALFVAGDVLMVALGGTTVAALGLELARLRWLHFNQAFFKHLPLALKETEARTFTGATYLLIGSVLAFILFRRDIAVAALLLLAIGDPLAGMVGEKFGKHRFLGRSLEGSLACLAGGTLVAVSLWMVHLDVRLLAMVAGVVAAAVMEMAPLPLDDNLSIPLASGGIISLVTYII